jgi:hypothetical protein
MIPINQLPNSQLGRSQAIVDDMAERPKGLSLDSRLALHTQH